MEKKWVRLFEVKNGSLFFLFIFPLSLPLRFRRKRMRKIKR